MHDRHNKDEVLSFEQYCDIIAKMKISHDPKMQHVSRILSDVEYPTLNKAVHDVKEGFRRTTVDCCKNGGTKATQHACDKASRTGGDINTSMSMSSDKASRTGGDIGMSASMGSGGDMSTSMSMGKGTCIDKRQDESALIGTEVGVVHALCDVGTDLEGMTLIHTPTLPRKMRKPRSIFKKEV